MPHPWLTSIADSLPAWLGLAATPGAAVALIEPGQTAQIVCAGSLKTGATHPVTPDTVFEAASLSKPLFAYATLRLCEQGLLDLDAPLNDILPEPLLSDDPRLPQITVRRVLSHAAGLPNWRSDARPLKIYFDPGSRFGYSGEGYVYLQRVVEQVTAEPLEAHIQRTLLDPLAMTSTSYTWQPSFEGRYAQGHNELGYPLPKNCPGLANVATTLHTTANDFARFTAFLLDPSIAPQLALTARCRATMLTPQIDIQPGTAWGLGWGLKQCNGDCVFWQWGDNTGFKHLVAASPQRGLGLVVFTNSENGWQVWKQAAHRTIDSSQEIFNWLSTI